MVTLASTHFPLRIRFLFSFYHSEHPKIWLPRALRQTYIRKVGDTVNLLIPFQVITPTLCWDQVRALTWRQN